MCATLGTKRGDRLSQLECVNSSTDRAVLQKELIVDPLTTKRYDEKSTSRTALF
jgi:hypothetical protein